MRQNGAGEAGRDTASRIKSGAAGCRYEPLCALHSVQRARAQGGLSLGAGSSPSLPFTFLPILIRLQWNILEGFSCRGFCGYSTWFEVP